VKLKFSYFVYKKAVAPQVCDQIIALLSKEKKKLGTVADKRKVKSKKQREELFKFRNSKVAFRKDPFLYRVIHPFIKDANEKAGWNFQWDSSESCQLTEYSKGQYYHWHQDSWDEPYKKGFFKGKIRKLSSVLVLTDGSKYTGGDLEFNYPTGFQNTKTETHPFLREKGSLVVFPSFIYHRVTPVKKGTRHSLTTWHLGHPYV